MYKLDHPDRPRLTARVTRYAFLRYAEACERLEREEASHVQFGRILIQLAMEHLPPCSEEKSGPRLPAELTAAKKDKRSRKAAA
jgi:hypothetical protein